MKNKAANVGKRRGEHSQRRPLPFFAQDEDELFVTGSTLYAGDGGQIPLQTQPPWSQLRFLLPNRPTKGRKQGGVCPGSFGRTLPETIGDSRTEFTL